MILSRLDILQVRNLQDVHVLCHPKGNVIYGANGSGKTSLLEAIYLLGRGRSFRHRDLRLVIGEYATELVVSARVERSPPQTCYQLGVKRTVAGRFEARLDGASLQSSAQLVEALPLQLIDAHSFTLLEGGPLQRRQFLDWGVFHVEHGYSSLWKRFQKALKQRNQLLRHGRMDEGSLSAWTAELVPLSEEISRYRRDYLSALSQYAGSVAGLFGGLGPLELEYYQGWATERSLEESLGASRARDIATGTTNVGSHKADFIIKVDGSPAAERLSRGQIKLLVYALKLAQAAYYRENTGRGCVFLLDDLPAELDYQHRGQVVSCLNGLECQYFMTGVDRKDFDLLVEGMAHQMFHMEHGVASKD
jgi:DNA replication and repair protein RecF